MDNVFRLVFVLVLFFISSAAIATTALPVWRLSLPDTVEFYDTTTLCTQYTAYINDVNTTENLTFTFVFDELDGAIAACNIDSEYYGEVDHSRNTFAASDYYCPAGTLNHSTNPPTCDAGCTPDQLLSSGFYDLGKDPHAPMDAQVCVNGCSGTFDGVSPFSQAKQADGMHYYAKGAYYTDGFECSGGSSPPDALPDTPVSADNKAASDAAADAAAAQAAKDAAAQAAADSTAAAKELAASTAAAAEAAKAAAESASAAAVKANNDPNSTQAEKDAATAAAASAAEAAADAAGQAAAASMPDTPKEQPDFCELHPSSTICKTSSINTGYCNDEGQVSGFYCDGDAVTCAIAQTEVSSFCLINQKDDALTLNYTNAVAGTGFVNPAAPENALNVYLPTSLDETSDFSGQCNEDVTVSLGTNTVTVPFSAWCPELEALGFLFLACAYIAAAKIIGGSV